MVKNQMEIMKVRKEGTLKKVSIPRKSDIQVGDYVLISKIEDPNFKLNSKEQIA